MEEFKNYLKNKKNNSFSKTSEFWKKQKEYTINKTSLSLPEEKDIKNLRRWSGRIAMGNKPTIQWFKQSLERIKKAKIPLNFSSNIKESDYGNPFKMKSEYGDYSGMFLLNLINSYVISNLINIHIENKTLLNICEIGTGWGQMCEILDQKYDINSYTSIDLSETLCLAYLNAIHNFKKEDINLVDTDEVVKKYNYCIPENINHLYNKKFDVFINCFSFQEMSPENTINYIDFIKKTLKETGIFVSINSFGRLEINNFSDFYFQKLKIISMEPSLRRAPAGNVIPITCCMKNIEKDKEYDINEINKKAIFAKKNKIIL